MTYRFFSKQGLILNLISSYGMPFMILKLHVWTCMITMIAYELKGLQNVYKSYHKTSHWFLVINFELLKECWQKEMLMILIGADLYKKL